MARRDLLSEAIADAKAVKETAMANAKLALEEAFTPKLQSMISAKLAEEAEAEEDENEVYSEEEDEMDVAPEMTDEEDMEMDSEEDITVDMDMDSEEEVTEEEEDMEMDSEEDEDELDLESIIRELEDENEMGSEEEVTEEEMDSEEEEMASAEEVTEEEEIDLDEVIRTLKEMEDDSEEEMTEEEDEDMGAELDEAYKTIKSLQTTINEVNLLNAKLLYTNKLFRTFDLNENQKVKVLENFDRTSSVREVKLVFSTLAENLNVAKKTKVVVREGYASKVTKSSAPKKQIISEGNELAARWKKLAGLI
jgi:hypothetical protein